MTLAVSKPVLISLATGFAAGVGAGILFSKVPVRFPGTGASEFEQRGGHEIKTTQSDSSPVSGSSPVSESDVLAADLRIKTQLREKGEYILDSEIALKRSQAAEHVKKSVDFYTNNELPKYDELFRNYGLDPQTSELLKIHLAKIYKAKIEASAARSQALEAQFDFEQRMKYHLGDKFEDYKAYELSTPVRQEAQQFSQFAKEAGVQIPEAEMRVIQETLQEHRAYSFATRSNWGGPFQNGPDPAFGQESVLAVMQNYLSEIDQSSKAVVSKLAGTNLSLETQGSLKAYFNQQIVAAEDNVLRSVDPIGTMIRRREEELVKMKADPNSAPTNIRRLEAAIERLRAMQPGRK